MHFGIDAHKCCWLQEQSNHEGRPNKIKENPHWSGQYAYIFVSFNPWVWCAS